MAVRYEDLARKLSIIVQEEVDLIEQTIDRHLESEYAGGIATISKMVPKTEASRAELVRRYCNAGWELTFEDDREGGFARLTPLQLTASPNQRQPPEFS